ncbi:MAG: endonuclease domain-containing protein, partial [bacterium]
TLRRRQRYRCGVCRRHEGVFKQRLAVDHDHHTGRIRGLLCTHCNRYVIGRHRDPEIFRRAFHYLKHQTDWVVPPKKKRKRKKK